MKTDDKKKQIQQKYKDELENKRESKHYPKKLLIFAVIVVIFFVFNYFFGVRPFPEKEEPKILKPISE
ncbi:hypothetical protein [Priestia megaterium]|uniref:hypothetical protein n=1 Tax=Priestia megaterium TaxID=1404 RepID=UPI001A9483DD|nr:hypothetical protein [Priestia megaterium]QSX24170.1 hypothetical protein J0P05_31580 [Priestia megaterium]